MLDVSGLSPFGPEAYLGRRANSGCDGAGVATGMIGSVGAADTVSGGVHSMRPLIFYRRRASFWCAVAGQLPCQPY